MIDQIAKIYFDDCFHELMSLVPIEGNEVKNNLYNLVLTGTKGKFAHIKSMLVYIGFLLVDNEPLKA